MFTRPDSSWLHRLERVLPWASLAIGVTGALIMDRGPDRAVAVALSAVGAWLLLVGLAWLHRAHQHADPSKARLIAGLRFSSLTATQSVLQFALFFSLPFYWKAWAGDFGQLQFLMLITGGAVASLWDPLTERMLMRPATAPWLPALASFGGLNAVLPGLGLSNTASVWTAAIATACALPFVVLAISPRDGRWLRRFGASALVAAVLPLALALGFASMIPAAPLSLVTAEIGTHRRGRGVAKPVETLRANPGALICATSIWAPLGVRERLYHVWRQNGVVRDRIALDVRGGREAGFRTWSRKRNFGRHPDGTWTCSVETSMGQSLGSVAVDIG